MDEAIANFVGFTGASASVAEKVLSICGEDVEQAIQLWFSDEEFQRNVLADVASATSSTSNSNNIPSRPAASSSSSRARPSASRPSRTPNIGRQDEQGVIHLDSDEEDVTMTEDEGDDDLEAVLASDVARNAQEEEDAAMAKRLQEELYGGGASGAGGGMDGDDVRAPMARTTETLIAPNGDGWGGDMDDYPAGFPQMNPTQMSRFRAAQARHRASGNPFSQSIWDDPSAAAPAPAAAVPAHTDARSNRVTHLADLFRPPHDLITTMDWEEARDTGKDEKRWIMVNLQNPSDFHCQALNRDIWKDEAIKMLVKEHFIFIQYEKGDPFSAQYVNYYLGGDAGNEEMYPHVHIIDPRTGENVKTWSGTPFPSALDFHAQLVEFLDRYSLDANSKNPVVKKKPQPKKDIHAMTEEEMLEMALQNSLGSSSTAKAVDPDALTKSPEPESRIEPLNAKGKEPEKSENAASNDASNDAGAENEGGNAAFARIASDRPHAEPENNPAAVTRIQFRHPTGRIIRRFTMQDPVSRIYEWLKASPLEGKEGLEFELKVMPQGHDLIEDLDKTIADAGLKNGTVMIEFL